MSFNTEYESYLPVYDAVPENWEEGRQFLVEQLKRISNIINLREIGWFLNDQVLSGKQFIPGSSTSKGSYRSIFRKVIPIPSLPNASTLTIPHGVIVDTNFTLFDLWLSATDPTSLKAFTCSNVGSNPIGLSISGANVEITTNSNYSSFTRCFVVMEYLLEI